MALLQTHHYDRIPLDEISLKTIPENYIETILSKRNSLADPRAKIAVDLILRDRNGNKESYHNLDALTLLYNVFIGKNYEENKKLIEEQLADIIVSGPCSQGRCFRLYQLILAFGNYL